MASATKQALLAALSAAQGECISGQQLARQLGVSRAAVHKAAAALAAQGYALEAAPRRGYRLAGGDPFCAEAVGEYDAPIFLYDTLESSNRTAKTLALEGASHGTMVLAGQQTAGRGRLGRRFESPAGKGVYLSLVLRPSLPMTEAQAVTVSAAVAVCRAVKKLCGLELGIKWVNDLYYNGKKVCGILTEAALNLESGMLDYAVLGLGFNVIAPAEGWPDDLRDVAGALYDGTPAPGARAMLAAAFLNEFWPLYRAGPRSGCLDEYRSRQALVGRQVLVTPRQGEPRQAAALGINDEWKLIVRFTGESRPTALNSGEVSVRLL